DGVGGDVNPHLQGDGVVTGDVVALGPPADATEVVVQDPVLVVDRAPQLRVDHAHVQCPGVPLHPVGLFGVDTGAAVGFGGGELLALLDLAGDLHLRERVRHERAARPVLGAPAPVQQGEPDHLRRGGDNTRSHNSFPRVRVALSALGGPLGGALFRRGLTVHFGARVPRQRLLGGLYLRSRGGRRSGDGRGRGVLRVGYGFGRGRGGRLWQPRLPP